MINIDGRAVEAGAAVVAWLRDSLKQPAANPAEQSPAERLRPALKAASESDRNESLLALVDAMANAEDTLRRHLMYALAGFNTDELHDRYVDLLEPAPASWITQNRDGLANEFFELLASGPGREDDRLTIGMRFLAKQHHMGHGALIHFITFHTADHGWQALTEHLDAGHELGPDVGWYVGSRFAKNAPQRLPEIAKRIASHSQLEREKVLEAASIRLKGAELASLKAELGV